VKISEVINTFWLGLSNINFIGIGSFSAKPLQRQGSKQEGALPADKTDRQRQDMLQSCRQQVEVIQNHENENVRNIGQGEAPHRKYKRFKLGGGHVYDCSSV
jgi:hypothetical protein